MEEQLHKEFRELRRRGLKVKRWWFQARAKQILEERNPQSSFKFSNGWFSRFKKRYRISLRRPTNTAQKPPSDKEAAIAEFHGVIREIQLDQNNDGQQEERFGLHQIANVDQTPLPFSFSQGPTYETTNSSSVWVRSAQSGLDKCQCTVQLTIFADGKPRVKPLIIFRGKGKRISLKERVQYDKRVVVHFQENAWCDGPAMEYWLRNCWKTNVKEECLLVLDLHRAQKTDNINKIFSKECEITPVFVPAGCTGIIQPLDVAYNAPFKKKVENAAMAHMQDNLERYVQGTFTAGERRVLITKWVGNAWEELSKNENIAIRAFKKCGVSTAADGSEDFEIHLEGLEDYVCESNQDQVIIDDNTDPFSDVSESCSEYLSDEDSLTASE